jgi:hypothetical protein
MNRYEIRVVGHLDARRARALGCEECRWLPDGSSLLVVSEVDLAATYGLLARLRDSGLELIGLQLMETSAADRDGGTERGRVEERDGR